MIFNSLDFFFFFPVVYFLYSQSNLKFQNILLLLASYFFYGYWDYRFLSLLILSSLVDYYCSLAIERNRENAKKKKLFLSISIFSNLGILGFFKYFNFFQENAIRVLHSLGLEAHPFTLTVILPLGISFYTFQTMSYTIDVYRNDLKACKSLLDFSLYVSFFPQLVAGPIERATRLLPQVQTERVMNWEKIQKGSFLVLLGFFKKVFVADNLAKIIDPIWSNPNPTGGEIFFAFFGFSFQIYGDFSGYSDIARGISMFLGFDLMENFRTPFYSASFLELFTRWHISLMQWFRDYVYFPLGGSKVPEWKQNFNSMSVFFLSGVWHGANWTFIIWGTYCGALAIANRYWIIFLSKFGLPKESWKPYLKPFQIFLTLFLFSFSAILFRAQNIEQTFHYFQILFSQGITGGEKVFRDVFRTVAFLYAIEYFPYSKNDEFAIFKLPVWARVCIYLILFYAIIILGSFDKDEFIYFVF